MSRRITRRRLLEIASSLPFAGGLQPTAPARAAAAKSRVRPGDPGWPSEAAWDALNRDVGGRLVKVRSPLAECIGAANDPACADLFRRLKNPYFLGDEPGLTQSLGWVGAWTSWPSVYAVAAKTAADVVAAVNFARDNNLRLVVKGGGHSYQGTSNAADSLLVWTRPMNAIVLNHAFVGIGCAGKVEPQPAVSIGAGAIWRQAYDAVTTKGGRYVQGGGCMTVGVAGLVLGGGFGSFSKAYGMAGASLIEAEVVTADGAIRFANACSNPDLFWALKGGGGGFGIVTRVTLRTHALPEFFGRAFLVVHAASTEAQRRLVARTLDFYADALFNPHWGEQIRIGPDFVAFSMVFQGLDQAQAQAIWKPFFDWITASPRDFALVAAPRIEAAPARRLWDPSFLAQVPGAILADDRPNTPADNVFWTGNLGEAGAVWYTYQSAWLPASLLKEDKRRGLADALFEAARRHEVTLHCNKGLAGAADDAIAAARETATNPAATEAFALLIAGGYGEPAYPGVPGHEPDAAAAARVAKATSLAMDEIRKVAPASGSYVWETDYFEPDWRESFWGGNYPRLRAVKDKYDPDGLFFLHHGVGSEDWSADGMTRVK